MKRTLLCGLFLAAALTAPVQAQISVYIGAPPPPLRYEVPPPLPGPGFVWVEGFWAVQGRHYRWVPGHYDQPPYPGAYWSHPHYDHYPEGWRFHEGHWDREDHDNHDHGHGHDR